MERTLWHPLRGAGLVAALALLAHLPALWNGFVFDDHYEIEENRALREPFSLRFLMSTEYWGTGSHTGWYRPVPLILQKVLFDIAGTHPFPYHLAVLAGHVLLAGLLAWLIAKRFALPRGALIVGTLFAVHTVHAEAVSTAYGLKEVLAGLFSFSSLAVLGGWKEELPWSRLVRVLAAALLLALGILSKESAVPVPAVLFAADLLRGSPWMRLSEAIRRNGRAALFHGALFAAAGFAAVSMRFRVVEEIVSHSAVSSIANPVVGLGQPLRLAMGLRLAALYGRMLVWPVPFSPTYTAGSVPVPHSILAPDVLIGASLLILIAIAVARSWRLRAPAGIGAVWAAATYLLASNLILPFGTLMSERFLYLPSLGLALLLAPAADRLLGRALDHATPRRIRRAALVLAAGAAAAVAALGALTIIRSPVYGDDRTLMRRAYRWYPGGVIARRTQASEVTLSGRFDDAQRELEELRAAYPDLPRVDEMLAMNSLARGDRQAAIGYWARAVDEPTADIGTYHSLAVLLMEAGDTDGAIRQLSAGIRKGEGVYRKMARARELRGVLLLKKGRMTQALADLRLACAIDPANPGPWADLATALVETGDEAEAEAAFRRALSLVPENADSLRGLGGFLLARRRGEEAVPLLERLVALSPNDLIARSNLGAAWMQAQRFDRAEEVFQAILSRDPAHLVALATLGSLQERKGRAEEARRLYERYLASSPGEGPFTAEVRSRLSRLQNPR